MHTLVEPIRDIHRARESSDAAEGFARRRKVDRNAINGKGCAAHVHADTHGPDTADVKEIGAGAGYPLRTAPPPQRSTSQEPSGW